MSYAAQLAMHLAFVVLLVCIATSIAEWRFTQVVACVSAGLNLAAAFVTALRWKANR